MAGFLLLTKERQRVDKSGFPEKCDQGVSSQNAPHSCTRSNTIRVRWGQVSSRSLGTGVCTSSLPLPVASVWGQGVGGCPCRWPRAVRTLVGGRQRPVLQERRPLPGEPGWEQSCRGGSRLRDRGDGRRWGRTRVSGMEGAARAPLSRSPAESRAGFGGPEPRPWAERPPRGGARSPAQWAGCSQCRSPSLWTLGPAEAFQAPALGILILGFLSFYEL